MITSANIVAHFAKSGYPVAGLSPVIKIWDIDTSTIVVASDPMVEVGNGFYKYLFTTYDAVKNYGFIIDGGAFLPSYARYIYGGNTNFAEDIAPLLNVSPYVSFD